MLSPASLSIVRQTLPAVGAAVPEITTLFYGKLFADHPELLSDLFNRGNQATGAQQQALAGSIARFATLVVNNPDHDPGAVLGRIAHKHASLGVTADQYKIVHTYLFAAIADVLGAAVTAEVAAAWDELYWLMARTLIDLEAGACGRDAGHEPGPSWQPCGGLARHEETADYHAVSFILAACWWTARRLDSGRASTSVSRSACPTCAADRQYSLSSAAALDCGKSRSSEFAMASAPDGEVSNWLHGNVAVGDMLTPQPPYPGMPLWTRANRHCWAPRPASVTPGHAASSIISSPRRPRVR
jgi:nitric oxide dioxygenase